MKESWDRQSIWPITFICFYLTKQVLMLSAECHQWSEINKGKLTSSDLWFTFRCISSFKGSPFWSSASLLPSVWLLRPVLTCMQLKQNGQLVSALCVNAAVVKVPLQSSFWGFCDINRLLNRWPHSEVQDKTEVTKHLSSCVTVHQTGT